MSFNSFCFSGFQIFSANPTAGPSTGATIVTLNGEDLSDATGCKFGSTVVAVNSYVGFGVQSSSIICTSPSQGSAASVTTVSAVIDGDISTNLLTWTFYGERFLRNFNFCYVSHHIRVIASIVAFSLDWSYIWGDCDDNWIWIFAFKFFSL
jgi:hypothetical protein